MRFRQTRRGRAADLDSFLAEIRSFEPRGYVVKSGVSERFYEDGAEI
jgi:hypothetical protein